MSQVMTSGKFDHLGQGHRGRHSGRRPRFSEPDRHSTGFVNGDRSTTRMDQEKGNRKTEAPQFVARGRRCP